MNAEKSQLPREYSPFEELDICSNSFINGVIPLEVHGNIVFLVGQGEHPAVWVSAPASAMGDEWMFVVENNQALYKEAVVEFPENATVVLVADTILLYTERLSEQKAEVTSLDLRPLGLNVYGDRNGLNVGGQRLIGNTFRNVHTMVGIGD